MTTPTEDLIQELKDPEFARLYGAEQAKMEIGMTLTKIRKSLRLTQAQLSVRLGVSQPYVAELESGEANPTVAKIGSLLAALNLRLVAQTLSLAPEVAMVVPTMAPKRILGNVHTIVVGSDAEVPFFISGLPIQQAETCYISTSPIQDSAARPMTGLPVRYTPGTASLVVEGA